VRVAALLMAFVVLAPFGSMAFGQQKPPRDVLPSAPEGKAWKLVWHDEFDGQQYVFYVDGREMWRTKAGGVCQVPLYIKLSDEVGNWGGDIKKATLPDRFLVADAESTI